MAATNWLLKGVALSIVCLNTSCNCAKIRSAEESKHIPVGWMEVDDRYGLSFYAPRGTVELPTQTFECCGNRFKSPRFSIMYFYSSMGNGFDRSAIDKSDTISVREINNNVANIVYGSIDNPDCEGKLFETAYISKRRIFSKPIHLEFMVCAESNGDLKVADEALNSIRFGR